MGRKRQSNKYMQLSQFQRSFHHRIDIKTYHHQRDHREQSQIWKPSFSFHFTLISTIRRYYRQFVNFFNRQPTYEYQSLPYYNASPSQPPPSTRNSSSSSSYSVAVNWISYYWRRILLKKTSKEFD